jgi:hypothetical protein
LSTIVTLCSVAYLGLSPLHPQTRHETLLTGSYAACQAEGFRRHLGNPEGRVVDLDTAEGLAVARQACGEDLRGCRWVR